jgi:hypothetical protein
LSEQLCRTVINLEASTVVLLIRGIRRLFGIRPQNRYMRVDPNNHLVVDTLEALWNDKLRQLERARNRHQA